MLASDLPATHRALEENRWTFGGLITSPIHQKLNGRAIRESIDPINHRKSEVSRVNRDWNPGWRG